MEHHLSIFHRYERDTKHEDQLPRAALIVIKLVPLANEAFLSLGRCQPLATLPRPMDHFDIRPSSQVTRSWPFADAVARDYSGHFIAEVRDAIDQVLTALGEKHLKDIQSE